MFCAGGQLPQLPDNDVTTPKERGQVFSQEGPERQKQAQPSRPNRTSHLFKKEALDEINGIFSGREDMPDISGLGPLSHHIREEV